MLSPSDIIVRPTSLTERQAAQTFSRDAAS